MTPTTSNVDEQVALTELRGQPVKVFLAAKNIALRGHLIGHDSNSVTLEDEMGRTIIYKPQIISITEDE